MAETNADWREIWKQAPASGTAIAMWRLPNQGQQFLIQDSTGGLRVEAGDLEQFGAGFLFGPFIGQPSFLHAAEFSQKSMPELPKGLLNSHVNKVDEIQKQTFQTQVAESIQQIKMGHFQKVVLSRVDEQGLSADFDLVDAFDRLCQAYASAFVSAIYLPDLQSIWLCATPETLVSQDSAGVFRTISLAGTQSGLDAAGELWATSEARWSQKEIEEQAYVSRYIIECFKKIRLREFVENATKTVLAGNLLHSKTEYYVNTSDNSYPGSIPQMCVV